MGEAVGDDLEALFDQISAERTASSVVEKNQEEIRPKIEDAGVFNKLGGLTRTLHEALRELGYDKAVQGAVDALPGARDRLAYITSLTGQAAEKTLGAVEKAQAVQAAIQADAGGLHVSWQKLFAGELGVDAFKALAADTRDYLARLPAQAKAVDGCLHDVMMAQDFHDLTGQVVQKVVKTAQGLEEQLIKLLVETTPPERRAALKDEWLSGPAIDRTRADVAHNQAQVDALLDSLGF